MIWRIGSLFAAGPTVSKYPGYGILFENLPTTGEQGGSPLLNDGGVAGDEIRWKLLSTTGDLVVDFFTEDGRFGSTGIGTATYQRYKNNVPDAEVWTITVLAPGDNQAITVVQLQQVTELAPVNVSGTQIVTPVTLQQACELTSVNVAAIAVVTTVPLQQLTELASVDIEQLAPGTLDMTELQQVTELQTVTISTIQLITCQVLQQITTLVQATEIVPQPISAKLMSVTVVTPRFTMINTTPRFTIGY